MLPRRARRVPECVDRDDGAFGVVQKRDVYIEEKRGVEVGGR